MEPKIKVWHKTINIELVSQLNNLFIGKKWTKDIACPKQFSEKNWYLLRWTVINNLNDVCTTFKLLIAY